MMDKIIVAVGIVRNQDDEILLSQRRKEVYLGGQWEFPGGKQEQAEAIEDTLKRELDEELAIKVLKFRKLIAIKHQYPKMLVNLQVYEIDSYKNQVMPKEGQKLKWVAANKLDQANVLVADLPIIKALNLPDKYLITPDGLNVKQIINLIENAIAKHKISLVQFRDTKLSETKYKLIANKLIDPARELGVKLLLNTKVKIAQELEADGVHLNSTRLMLLSEKPDNLLLAASCHNAQELLQADKLNADFVVLSQVLASKSHPENNGIGWNKFEQLLDKSQLPTYVLGGVEIEDIAYAKSLGAQGIAGISCFEI